MVEPQNINDSKSSRKVRLIQLSDPHLGGGADYKLSGVKTLESLNDVLADISHHESSISRFIVTGDIAAHGAVLEYQLFAKQMAQFNTPFSWLPGNHDDPQVMAGGLGVGFEREIRVGNWLLLLLNSKKLGEIGGDIDPEEIEYAAQAARKHEGPVAVFFHHPPVDVGCAWLDKQKVENSTELLGTLAACGNVKAIFTGHVHQDFTKVVNDISVHTSLSTCFQFEANSKDFALSSGGPGYRWLDLYNDGRIDTGVVQLDCQNNQVDLCSTGY
jgi:Icc protein